ncbi:hypothetical protein F2Q68_00029493 [Brassica cretica]|uniref:Uncharacterized protein n=1 Tax=Brassica cretica TaxID=69181 RepID=A0A8S9GCQ2_BRACR|nr:hypothetical protein F2Q68_00029493 [Brassica cretica]
MFASCLQIARGSMTLLHQVAPHLERVDNPAAGRRSKRHLHVFKSCGFMTSLHQVAPHLERVDNPAAGRRSLRHLHVFKSRAGS